VLSWQLDLPRPVRAQLDPFGNILHVLTMDEPHEAIIIGARGQVDIDELREAEHESQSALPFLRFTRLTEADAALRAFAENLQAAPRSHGADRLMHGLNQHMTYTPGATEVDTSAAQAFAGRAGVPGPHPCVPRLCPQPGDSGAVCLGLSVQRRQRAPGQPCLGRSLAG
jgi:transglutaminase-like putative cysteine protease